MGSFVDKRGNHIEMGLHVFFGCYNNLFRLMKKVRTSLLTVFIIYWEWHVEIYPQAVVYYRQVIFRQIEVYVYLQNYESYLQIEV